MRRSAWNHGRHNCKPSDPVVSALLPDGEDAEAGAALPPGILADLGRRFRLVWTTSWEDQASEVLAPRPDCRGCPPSISAPRAGAGPYTLFKLLPVRLRVGELACACVDVVGRDRHRRAARLRDRTLAIDAESGDGITGRIVDALHRFADDREAGDAVSPPFTIVPGGSSSPCILHVPHASEVIPDDARKDMLLDDCALELELRAMTDAHTDLIAAGVADLVDGPRPWMFVNCLSRLVVDPERFPDEREVMNAVGMGAVYTRTSTGEALRDDNPKERAELISTWFDPYAAALAGLVDARIEAAGFAVIVDIHSYPRDPLPYELFADEARPEICLGCDEDHTPAWLRALADDALAPHWSIGVNEPFRGTYVPLRHYRRDGGVTSLMLEIRRDIYVRADGGPDQDAIQRLAAAIAALVAAITRARE